jgi:hypothetical protein
MGEEIQGLDPGLLKLGKIQGLDPGLLLTMNTNSGISSGGARSHTRAFLLKVMMAMCAQLFSSCGEAVSEKWFSIAGLHDETVLPVILVLTH